MQKKYLYIILLSLAVVVSYGSSIFYDFVWDDEQLIVDNQLIKDEGPLSKVFLSELHPDTSTNYYRPLQSLSFMLDYVFYKLNPFGYHFTNMLLHLAVGILLFLLLTEVTKKSSLSFAATLLFLVHPIHAEVATYISGRADSLLGVFAIASLLCYLKFLKGRAAPAREVYYLLSLVLAMLALLTKELAVVFPVVILGFDIFIQPSQDKRILRAGPFFIVVLAYIFLRMSVLNFSFGNPILMKKGFAIFEISLIGRLWLFFKSLVIYLGSLFIPVNLHMERYIALESVSLFHWLGLAIFAGISLFVFLRVRQARGLIGFCMFWFFVWLMLQSAILFPKRMADHFLYLPSVGVFLIMALYIDSIGAWEKKRLLLVLISFYFCLFSWFYSYQWRSDMPFFLWTVKYAPQSFRVRDSLANLYLKEGRYEDAIREYKFILDPKGGAISEQDFVLFAQEVFKDPIPEERRQIASAAFYNLGVIYASLDRTEEAQRAYQYSILLNPKAKLAYNNLGLLYEKRGFLSEAIHFYQKAIAVDAEYLEARNNLGSIYARTGDLEGAISLWRKTLEINPSYETAKKNIALAEELRGIDKKD